MARRLDAQDFVALSESLRLLYEPATPQEFPKRVHTAFARLLPAVCVSYDELNVDTGVTFNAINRKFPISDEELFERWSNVAPHHPWIVFYRNGGKKTTAAVSDLLTQRQLREGPFFQDFWRVVGVRDQICLTMPEGRNIIGLAVNHDAIYTPEQVFLMELIQPHFVQAYKNARLLGGLQAIDARSMDFTPWRRAGLTRRECEVLQWVMEGKRNSEIAVILGMSPGTAKLHVEHILAKFGAETRAGAAARARELIDRRFV